MGKKGGALNSIFSGVASPPWRHWPPSCRDPRTASFRADGEEHCSTTGGGMCGPVAARHRRLLPASGEMYKTVNSVYLDTGHGDDDDASSCQGEKEDDGLSTMTEEVIRSLSRSTSCTDRFFFDQGPASTNSILAPPPPMKPTPAVEEREAAPFSGSKELVDLLPPHYSINSSNKSLVEESVAVPVDSTDPYRDFRASMEEMVAAHGLSSWDALEELLAWYLRVNAKRNHPLIVRAFVDLLVGLVTTSPSTTTTTDSTLTSSSSSSTASTSSTKTTTTASAAAMEQCGGGGGGGTEASPSSSSSCSCARAASPAGGVEED